MANNPEYTKSTVAIALVYKCRVYMSRRLKTVNFSGLWQFPGGKVEGVESSIEAAHRELIEETGIYVDPSRLHYIGPVLDDPTTAVCYIYALELFDGEVPLRKEPEKASEWRLFPFDLALQFETLPGIPKTLRYLKNNFKG